MCYQGQWEPLLPCPRGCFTEAAAHPPRPKGSALLPPGRGGPGAAPGPCCLRLAGKAAGGLGSGTGSGTAGALLMTWFEMRILHLSGSPVYFGPFSLYTLQ